VSSNLVPGDTNGFYDIYVRDRSTGTTERVSVDSSGNQANGSSYYPPSVSADGRFVAFSSDASNLVSGDTNRSADAFVHEFVADTNAPNVVSAGPAKGATDVSRVANIRATFSERVYYVKPNFVLHRRGYGTPVAAVVSPVEGTANTKWVLNPKEPLRAGTTYVARVKTGVMDKVGHHLDQSPTLSGNQPKEWTFKTRR